MNQPGAKVVVGIPVNLFPPVDRKFYKNKELQLAESSMCEAVANAGGLPLLLPISSEADVPQLIAGIDGLLLAGGADISPPCYGETAVHPDWAGQPRRDAFETALYKEARARQKPILGVCRGVQMINVVEGGSLWQDLESQRDGSSVHRSQELYDTLDHSLRVTKGSVLEVILGAEEVDVNTVHHQGLKEVAPTLTPIAWSPDGLVEAVIHASPPFTFGVQWHPEWMVDSSQQKSLFRYFIQEVEKARTR